MSNPTSKPAPIIPKTMAEIDKLYQSFIDDECVGGLESSVMVTDSTNGNQEDIIQIRKKDKVIGKTLGIYLGGIYQPQQIKIIFEENRHKYGT